MNNRFSNGRLSYSFTPRIHGNVLAWVKPASESEESKRGIENILRWEDDGGRMVEASSSTLEWLPVRPIRPDNHDQSMFQRVTRKGETQ